MSSETQTAFVLLFLRYQLWLTQKFDRNGSAKIPLHELLVAICTNGCFPKRSRFQSIFDKKVMLKLMVVAKSHLS